MLNLPSGSCRVYLQADRQKQQDEEWEQQEQKRREALEAKEKAERELEEQKQQQSASLAELRAKLDGLKAQKQDMVEKLKQVCTCLTACGRMILPVRYPGVAPTSGQKQHKRLRAQADYAVVLRKICQRHRSCHVSVSL